MEPLDIIKVEIAGIITRLENIEGHFDNFDTTLNNHMTDYDRKLSSLRQMFGWAFWVLFGLFIAAFSGLIGIAVALVQYYLKGG